MVSAMFVLFLVDRSHRTDDRFLVWKVRLFAIGATLGLAGIFLDVKALVWAAIGVLVVGFFLRFMPPAPRSDADVGPPESTE